MIIKKVYIEKFRGFRQVEFNLGENITVISGQNGTQKTTLLGLLSQPFSISDPENPIHSEKPLCGGNFKSGFSEKFKLSPVFDKAKEHEWSIFTDNTADPFIIESIPRSRNDQPGTLRFWKKNDKSRGSGYLSFPVIYLSLKRLYPFGEDQNIKEDSSLDLKDTEIEFLSKWYRIILLTPDLNISQFDNLSSTHKNTLGITTNRYDWRSNSAGQDNLGKILLAILSFKRLKEKYSSIYKAGLLVIDEVDATLYPASQLKLLEALRNFSSKFNIQIIFSTHSTTLLEACYNHYIDKKIAKQFEFVYLKKIDDRIVVLKEHGFQEIKDDLYVTLSSENKNPKKIITFTEDREAEIFMKALLKTKRSYKLDFMKCTLGCENYLELSRKKVRGFNFPESIICLDGDVKTDKRKMKHIQSSKNIILLPGNLSPERLLAVFLYNEQDSSPIWDKITSRYTKQICFKDYTIDDIQSDRSKAKEWFNSQIKHWGRGASKLVNIWIKKNNEEYQSFIDSYDELMNKFIV